MTRAPDGGTVGPMPILQHDATAEAATVHVVPGRKGRWTVRASGEMVASIHPSAAEAERAAHRYARGLGASRIVVHDRYCRVQVTSLGD
jgi:hypothetical protein